jgi:hypothetical protein
MRTVSSSIMAALVVVALFWGNCFSCPQLLAALHSQQPDHGCCHKTGPASTECQSQGLKNFVKAPQGAQAEALPVAMGLAEVFAVAALDGDNFSVAAAEHAAPDLLSLYSSFRI